LFDYLAKKQKISEKEAFKIIKIIFQTLNYLHNHNIFHRDIKPENIVFAEENEISSIKLIDFGSSERSDPTRIF